MCGKCTCKCRVLSVSHVACILCCQLVCVGVVVSSVIRSRFGRPCAIHAGRGCDIDRRCAILIAIHRSGAATYFWMFRERGRCGECQVVLFKFTNMNRNRHCDSCSAALGLSRRAYHCETCSRFACRQCTNASRRSSVPAAPKRPGHARLCHCGHCSAVLVRIQVTRASADRHCDSCSDALEYRRYAFRCESCARITCTQCTSNLRGRVTRANSPFRGLRGPVRCSCCRRKRLRLSPAGATAESGVHTTEQQPVDTAGADEQERAQMAHMHEREKIRYALEIYREARMQIRDRFNHNEGDK